jgi:hypothetical protein
MASNADAVTAKRERGRPRNWYCRFRPRGAPAAFIEQCADGRWRIIVGRREIAVVASSTVADAVVDQLDASHTRK